MTRSEVSALPRVVQALRLPPSRDAEALANPRGPRRDAVRPAQVVPRGSGAPLLVVGGFGATKSTMQPFCSWLGELGYEPLTFCWHRGLDCGERSALRLEAELAALAADAQPALVLAHSRGGQFARVAITRRPELASGLVTLGTPFAHIALQPALLAQAAVLSALGTMGLPNVIRLSCVRGRCCERFRADLRAPWPAQLPLFSIYSREDRTVRWQTCLDPAAVNISISSTHEGLLEASRETVGDILGSRAASRQ